MAASNGVSLTTAPAGRPGGARPATTTSPKTGSGDGMRPRPVDLRRSTYTEALARTVAVGVQSAVSAWVPDAVVQSGAQLMARITGQEAGTPRRARILWASFESAYVRPLAHSTAGGTADSGPAPRRTLYLVLGYEDGWTLWNVDDLDDVHEVVSVRTEGAAVRCVRVLDTPIAPTAGPAAPTSGEGAATAAPAAADPTRPHLAVVTVDPASVTSAAASGMSAAAASLLRIVSLRTYATVHEGIKCPGEVHALSCNGRLLLAHTRDELVAFDLRTYRPLFSLNHCQANPYRDCTVAALGSRWLAYASTQRVPPNRLAAAVEALPMPERIDARSQLTEMVGTLTTGLLQMGDRGVQALSRYLAPTDTATGGSGSGGAATATATASGGTAAPAHGTIMVRDIGANGHPIIAHFQAHDAPIVALAFNPSGTLLATASVTGHEVNIFQVLPLAAGDVASPCARHLYKLRRGLTHAIIADIAFNVSSRWVAVTSARGTTHLFPINPMGGLVDVSTHAARPATNGSTGPRGSGTAADARPAAYPASLITVDALARIRQPYLATGLPADDEGVVPGSGTGGGSSATGASATRKWIPPLAVRFWGHETEELVVDGGSHGSAADTIAAAASNVAAAATTVLSAALGAVGRGGTAAAADAGASRGASGSKVASPPLGTAAAPPAQPSDGGSGAPGMHLQRVQRLLTVSATGMLSYWELKPYREAPSTPDGTTQLRLTAEEVLEWDIFRSSEWPDVRQAIVDETPRPPTGSPNLGHGDGHTPPPNWLAHVDVNTHALPQRYIWQGPQFVFKTYQATGEAEALVAPEVEDDEGGIGGGGSGAVAVAEQQTRPVKIRDRAPVPYGRTGVVADEEWGGPEDLAENLSDAQSAPLPTLWPQGGRSWRPTQEKELNFEEDALFVAGPERDDDDDRVSRVAPKATYPAATASSSTTASPQPRAVLDSLPELEDYDDAVDEAAGALNAAVVTGPDGDNELGDPSMSIMPSDA